MGFVAEGRRQFNNAHSLGQNGCFGFALWYTNCGRSLSWRENGCFCTASSMEAHGIGLALSRV